MIPAADAYSGREHVLSHMTPSLAQHDGGLASHAVGMGAQSADPLKRQTVSGRMAAAPPTLPPLCPAAHADNRRAGADI